MFTPSIFKKLTTDQGRYMDDFSTKFDESGSRSMENVGGNSMRLSSGKKYDRQRTDFSETHACSKPFFFFCKGLLLQT